MSQKLLYPKNLTYLHETGKIETLPNANDLSQLVSLAERLQMPIEKLLFQDLKQIEKIQQIDIKMFVMDCDGVLTDGGMIYSKDGDEIKKFNVKDGVGINKLRKQGIITGIISAGIDNGLVGHRAKLLNLDFCHVNMETPKLDVLNKWANHYQIDFSAIAYIGDDLADIPVMKVVGVSFCPADAMDEVKKSATVILQKKGGKGCVREAIDEFLINK